MSVLSRYLHSLTLYSIIFRLWYNTQRPQMKTQILRPTLKKATYHLINHPGFERVPTGGRVLYFIAFMPWALLKFTH